MSIDRVRVLAKQRGELVNYDTLRFGDAIAGFEVGTGRLTYHPEAIGFEPEMLGAATLAAVGMSNDQIHDRLGVTERRAERLVTNSFDQLEMPYHQREGLPRRFFEKGAFQLIRLGEPLGLTERDKVTMDCVSRGMPTSEIKDIRGVSEHAIAKQLKLISQRTRWYGRTFLSLASLISGEITFDRDQPKEEPLRPMWLGRYRLPFMLGVENGLHKTNRFERLGWRKGSVTIDPGQKLSVRQNQVVTLGSMGLDQNQISTFLDIAPRTVMRHFAEAYDALGTKNLHQTIGDGFETQGLFVIENPISRDEAPFVSEDLVVLEPIKRGETRDEMAEAQFMSKSAIHTRIHDMLERTGTADSANALMLAYMSGIFRRPDRS